MRRDPPAVALPPTSPEPVDDRADLSPDEGIDEQDDTDNSLIIVNSPTPPVLIVADDVRDVVPGGVEVVPRQQLFPVLDPGQNVAGVQRMNDEGTTATSPPLRRSDRVRRRPDFFNSYTHHISQQTANLAKIASFAQGLLVFLLTEGQI